jgi:integrase
MASIKRRTDGKWRARYRDEAGKEHARHFERKVDAQRWLDEVTAAVVTGQYVDPKAGRVTFTSFYESWAPRQVWVSGTVKAMNLAAGSVTFGDVPLNRVRRSHVEAWVKAMEVKPLQPSTIHTRFVNARSVFRAAMKDRLIATDPTDDVTLPRRRRREAAMTIPTSEQVGAILDGAADQFKAFVAVAAFAGLRLGEAAALQVGDVVFLRRVLHVRRQVQRADAGEVEIRAPKYGSEREVYVPEQLTDMISAHIAAHCPDGEPTRWLFSRSDVADDARQPFHQNTVGHHWRAACKAASVTGFTLHDLRHYYASGLIAAGCDVVTVQRALGHSKATTTLNTYAHLWPTAEDRTRQASSGLIAMTTASARRTASRRGR